MTELDPNRDPIVVAAEAPNEIIAGLWASVLRDEGIEVMVKSTGPGMAYFSSMGNMHTIYVLESKAEEARKIIAELEEDVDFEEY
jgi:hypothetical protein